MPGGITFSSVTIMVCCAYARGIEAEAGTDLRGHAQFEGSERTEGGMTANPTLHGGGDCAGRCGGDPELHRGGGVRPLPPVGGYW